jgi:hypothetical protein
LELVYQEGRQLPGECFLPEDQWAEEEDFLLPGQEEFPQLGTELHHHLQHKRPMENM